MIDRLSPLALEALADAAKAEVADGVGLGSDYAKFNEFCDEVPYHMTEEQVEAWNEYSMHATGPEIVEEAMRVINDSLNVARRMGLT